MPDFRFRAQAALDLRRRQEDDAGAELARAQAAFHEVVQRQAAVLAERSRSLDQQLERQREGTDAGTIEWHWNWINKLAATARRLGDVIEARRQSVREAEQAWHEARRKRLALERLRERALRRHHEHQLRLEQKTVDELARLRFLLPHASTGRDDS